MLNPLFPNSPEEAMQLQRVMAKQVILEDAFSTLQSIGGMDVSNRLYDPEQLVYATTVVLDLTSLQMMEQASVCEKQTFPYIPGLLGFREAPSLVHAFEKLKQKPDVLMIDGHGISHPRGLGIASHLGVLLDKPTIGVAKSILVGHPADHLDAAPGSYTPLIWKNKMIGILYRSKARSNPLIISTGHKVSLSTALDLVQHSLKGYRLPEPTRQAHLAANIFRKNQGS